MAGDLSVILPRVLIVSRRTVRKNKFVDFVGEYHLDLIVSYGAAPVIVPRVSGVHMLLESFQPIHGVLLCEGEDIDPSLYDAELSGFSQEELEEIKKLHSSDTTIDREKDSIELALAKLCLERNIPYLGICRGSQVLNVACGGTLYQDLEKEMSKNCLTTRSDSPEMFVSSHIHPSSNIEEELSDNCQKLCCLDSSEMLSREVLNGSSNVEEEALENCRKLYCSDSSEMLSREVLKGSSNVEEEVLENCRKLYCSDSSEILPLPHPCQKLCCLDSSEILSREFLNGSSNIEEEVLENCRKLYCSDSSEMLLLPHPCRPMGGSNTHTPRTLPKSPDNISQKLYCSDSSEMLLLPHPYRPIRGSNTHTSQTSLKSPNNISQNLYCSDSSEILSLPHRGPDTHPPTLLKSPNNTGQKYEKVVHMNYENYDGHRHVVRIVENTPLHKWFKDSLEEDNDDGKKMEIWVNSYHHQGVKRLAQRFVPMAFANDGLIEGFYDPDAYNPDEGKFIMGLQFHPERMRRQDSGDFDYPGCAMAYQEFVKAVIAYEKKLNGCGNIPRGIKLNHELESKRKSIIRSFSIAKNMYSTGRGRISEKESELQPGAEFLEANTALSLQQEKRLKQMGATVRNASAYMNRLKMNEERERMARAVLSKMSIEQLSDMVGFYHKMGQLCSEALDKKFNEMELD